MILILLVKMFILEMFILSNAVYDSERIANDKRINHCAETLVRGAFMVGLALTFNWNLNAWEELLFFIFLFWQYDYVLNYVRVKPWWYLGNTFFDKFLKGRNLRYIRLGLKVVLVVGALVLLSRCTLLRPEKFYYTKTDIYHVSSYEDTTVLVWSDVKILQIDSLKSKFLELKAERE